MRDLLSILGALPSGEMRLTLAKHPDLGYRPYDESSREASKPAGVFSRYTVSARPSPGQARKQAESKEKAKSMNDWKKLRVDAAASIKSIALPVLSVMPLTGCYLGPNRYVYAIEAEDHIGQISSNDEFFVLKDDPLATYYCVFTLREAFACTFEVA